MFKHGEASSKINVDRKVERRLEGRGSADVVVPKKVASSPAKKSIHERLGKRVVTSIHERIGTRTGENYQFHENITVTVEGHEEEYNPEEYVVEEYDPEVVPKYEHEQQPDVFAGQFDFERICIT